MTQLIVLVCMYMLVSVGIGLWAARRVRNTADYAFSGVIEEPFGSGMALILVGMFFARKLYKMDLLTISDF